jgi:hypothetical protein
LIRVEEASLRSAASSVGLGFASAMGGGAAAAIGAACVTAAFPCVPGSFGRPGGAGTGPAGAASTGEVSAEVSGASAASTCARTRMVADPPSLSTVTLPSCSPSADVSTVITSSSPAWRRFSQLACVADRR